MKPQSLKDVFNKLASADQAQAEQVVEQAEQQAELDEQTKLAYQQATDYDTVGRVLAHQVWGDLVKQASSDMPAGHGKGKKHGDGMPCSAECDEYGGDDEGDDKNDALEEKKASILARMAKDPEYVAQLVAKHWG